MSKYTTGGISRRTALAVIPAGALASTALPVTAASGDDSGLLALGAEFDRAFAEYLPAAEASNDFRDEKFERARKAGIDALDIPERIALLGKISADMDPNGTTWERCLAALARCTTIVDRIISTPARTVAGAALKARVGVAVLSDPHYHLMAHYFEGGAPEYWEHLLADLERIGGRS